MVVRSPICREGSLWGSGPRARHPLVHSVYKYLLCWVPWLDTIWLLEIQQTRNLSSQS